MSPSYSSEESWEYDYFSRIAQVFVIDTTMLWRYRVFHSFGVITYFEIWTSIILSLLNIMILFKYKYKIGNHIADICNGNELPENKSETGYE